MKSIVVLLTLFCLCQCQKGPKGCPNGWIRGNDRCYYISGNSGTFDDADTYCKSKSAYLATTITCQGHLDLIDVLVEYRRKCPRGQNCNEFWIGIHHPREIPVSVGRWITTDNNLRLDDEDCPSCQQWGKGFPYGDGKCVFMNFIMTGKRGTWKNTNCERKLKYICMTCPSGFDFLPNINDCLYFNVIKANWNAAQQACSKIEKKAHLLTIHDREKQRIVRNYLRPKFNRTESEICVFAEAGARVKRVWMGGQTSNPNECKSPFVWKPLGEPQIPFTYTNFLPGRPNCGNMLENCVVITTVMEHVFRWQDTRCDLPHCSICEL